MQNFDPPVALIANGQADRADFLKKQLAQYKTIIAVDGGLDTCHKLKVTPHAIIGDMDSASAGLLQLYPEVKKSVYPAKKNATDLELALLKIKEQNITHATVFCALNKRWDHSLYNLYLLKKFKEMLTIKTEQQTLFFISDNREVSCIPGQTISLLPLGTPAVGVTSSGLQWELRNAYINQEFMSISNVCLGNSFSLNIEQGGLLCFLLRTDLDNKFKNFAKSS